MYIINRFWSGSAAKIGALIYLLWPGQWVYSAVITEEHVAAFLSLLIVNGMLEMMNPERSTYRIGNVCWVIAAGIACGLISFFKDWGIVYILAAIICSVWQLIRLPSIRQRVQLLISLALVITIRFIISTLLLANAEQVLGVPASNNVIVAEMFTTLDPNTSGSYNAAGDAEYYAMAVENDYDYDKTNRQAMELLKERIEDGIDRMPAHLLKKGTEAYGDDSSMLYWALKIQNTNYDESQPTPTIIKIIWKVAAIYYVFIIVSILAGGIVCKPNLQQCMLMAVCIGGMCASLLIESHGRYKYSIEPAWCILAAVNLKMVISKLEKPYVI